MAWGHLRHRILLVPGAAAYFVATVESGLRAVCEQANLFGGG